MRLGLTASRDLAGVGGLEVLCWFVLTARSLSTVLLGPPPEWASSAPRLARPSLAHSVPFADRAADRTREQGWGGRSGLSSSPPPASASGQACGGIRRGALAGLSCLQSRGPPRPTKQLLAGPAGPWPTPSAPGRAVLASYSPNFDFLLFQDSRPGSLQARLPAPRSGWGSQPSDGVGAGRQTAG